MFVSLEHRSTIVNRTKEPVPVDRSNQVALVLIRCAVRDYLELRPFDLGRSSGDPANLPGSGSDSASRAGDQGIELRVDAVGHC